MITITIGDRTIIIRRPWWKRLGNAPFEIGLSLFSIYSGVSGLLNFGASNEIFTEAVLAPGIFNMIFIVSGLSVIAGLVTRLRGMESFGLFGIIGALLTRIMVILMSTGWNVTSHNLLATCIFFVLACIVRLLMIPSSEHYFIE
jgi:hypothetical protein